MARGAGKLIPFFRTALDKDLYPNLKYVDVDTFYLNLPRFDKKKEFLCRPYERILLDWYLINGRIDKYVDYSTAKAGIQVALNRCVYLVTLGNKRYRFATANEIEENRQLLRLNMMRSRNLSSDPLIAALSGSVNSSEESEMLAMAEGNFQELNHAQIMENMGLEDTNDNDDVSPMQSSEADILDQLLDENLEMKAYDSVEKLKKYLEDDSDVSCKNGFGESIKEVPGAGHQGTSFDGVVQHNSMLNQVFELKPVPVGISVVPKKTYWLCTEKIKVGGLLMLICEKRDIEDGINQTVQEGSISIPTNALEPGISYEMKKSFQLHDKYFCILLPSV